MSSLRGCFGAEFVEGADEFAGDLLGRGLLDDVALHEVDELAVAQDGDGGRAGGIAFEVAAGALRGFAILASEDRDLVIGLMGGVGQRQADAGTHLSRGASADGVDYQQGGARLGEGGVDFFGGAGFLDTGAHQFFAHRDHHDFWIQV